MARGIAPSDLVLRCYGYPNRRNKWYGVCLDLNLACEADTAAEMKQKMKGMILSYIETVLDTGDVDSIPDLLTRRAPIFDWVVYYLIKLFNYVPRIPDKRVLFKEFIPFNLATNNC